MPLDGRPAPSAFRKSWKTRREARYNHWCRGNVQNQVQLAFRSHWRLFQELLGSKSGRVLEVGCGRGSISSYFAEQGFECHLLDYSVDILQLASAVFATNGHQADFVQGDAYHLPYRDGIYDAVVSIGLLEHFDEVGRLLSEQIRVLASGGRLLAYIVPERPENIQRHWRWLNALLKRLIRIRGEQKSHTKPEIFRNDYDSSVYLAELKKMPVTCVEAFGLFPLPMVSHSPEFPFSLLPDPLERLLTLLFSGVLAVRRMVLRRNPWICRESLGQAFLVTAVKI